MTVDAFTCSSCGDILYGRTKQDSLTCCCGKTSLTGGPQKPTITVNGLELLIPQFESIHLKHISSQDLFWDWHLGTNIYGVVSDHIPYTIEQ